MARTGLSKSYYAIYAVTDGVISYSNGGLLGKAVDAEIELEDSDPDIFYADNGPAESAAVFGGGSLTITNDRLSLAPVAAILGLEVAAITTPNAGNHIQFPADLTPPYVGYGTIRKDVVDGQAKYTAVILYKVQFAIPSLSLATQGETVEFEGNELTATILRNDATPALWMDWAEFATEAAAEAYIKAALNIT